MDNLREHYYPLTRNIEVYSRIQSRLMHLNCLKDSVFRIIIKAYGQGIYIRNALKYPKECSKNVFGDAIEGDTQDAIDDAIK